MTEPRDEPEILDATPRRMFVINARTIAVAAVVALLASLAVVAQFRAEVGRLEGQRATERSRLVRTPASTPRADAPSIAQSDDTPVAPPFVVPIELPAQGGISGDLTVIVDQVRPVVAQDSLPQTAPRHTTVTVVGHLVDARPNTAYVVRGGDCRAGSYPQWNWAAGISDANGRTVLKGSGVAVDSGSLLWLSVQLQPNTPGPVVNGVFALADVTAHFDGRDPCVP